MSCVIGITGGIGSGKSAVTQRLEAHGITVVDADFVARQVVEPGRPALKAISAHFGAEILHPDGSLDRAALRKIVFENPTEREWLESITHPAIRDEIGRQIANATSPYVVLSSPLLLEAGQSDFADYVVVVDVPEAVQIMRTRARDNNDEALVRKIMAAQLPRDERIARGDEVINNEGSLEDLHQRVDALHQRLLARSQQR
ncbi:MAG: dephospho-CoA kinase [Luminiphilus sp.]|nr:dephospho-CoA kinase [Luminiphilus sp.]